ncbi:TOBE domain-containing protein [Luteimicrobium subarcticum]|uniref:Molybdopterin-binding protein n=1 Tax=Luteimicrobium subarcticum TaxID=620910 RepID=A0A2M8W1C8_9MICO|nr:TOBE domain-containing protein [Luteimicrobium subarcticum]PJI84734.1 molybdopterin-binding protein [Luteimicrobium subarcticum]
MTQLRVHEAARLLGVSDDTVRRQVAAGSIDGSTDASGHLVLDGASLATYLRDRSGAPGDGGAGSARNRFVGLVTAVTVDGVMAQVEVQAGPHRIVSLISAESAHELGLEVGTLATAVVKATSVMIDTPKGLG